MIVRLLLMTAIAVSVVAGDFFKPEYKNEISLDKDMMYKQKKIFKVLYHLNQPELNTALYSAGMEYNVEAHADDYTNKTVVKDFLRLMNAGFLPHDTVFSIYYPQTMKETLTVFRLMYFAKDWDTFYKTSLFLRNKLNHGVFAYAFYLAVMHRPDTKYMKLPAMYELFPHMFYNVEFMEKTHHFKEFGKFMPKYQSDYDAYIIPYNYSNYYLSDEYDYEQRLNYFTEDIGLNDYYFHFRNNFPFFMSGEEFGMTKNYRGEEYLYGHQMLFNRYFLERLSNELGHVEDYDYDAKFYAGYWPTMSYPNGMHFPSRQWDSYFPKSKFHMISRAEEFESRISQAVDSGIAITKEGKTAKMYDPEGLNMLGNMIEGNADSINKNYYGNVEMLSRKILGFNLDPLTPEKLHPSALEHDSTTLRDPGFWRITKRFLHFYKEYKNHLGPYKTEEIEYPLLKIDDVHVDKLETFFEDYESWVSSNLAVSSFAEANRSFILARQKRLNHKPFNVQINITNNYSNKKAAIRIFLGPKYNPHYREIDFRDHHDEYYEMDSFIYDLSPGVNVVKRHCHDFFFVAEDPKPSSLLYDSIVKAAEGDLKFEKRIHAFPLRMLLPKGRPDGMPFQLFVHVAPVESEPVLYTSNVFGDSLLDSRPLGYPLDRPLDPWGFKAPNFFFKDVLIYHPSDYWYQHGTL